MAQWLSHHWFDILQTLGIVGGLLYSGLGFSLDRRMRRTELVLSLTDAHREIWESMIEQPELARVIDPNADAAAVPPSAAEARFVKLVLLHVCAVHRAILNRAYRGSPEMDEDVRQFLLLPIPRLVLAEFLPYQDREFRDYVASLHR